MYKSIMTTVTALALLGAGTAFAYSPPGGNGSGRSGWQAQHHHQPFAMLKTQLKLTSTQEPAWNQLMASMKAMRPHWSGKRGMKKSPELMTAPQAFDKMAKLSEKRAQNAQALARAVKKFYGHLTPVQRAVFDTRLQDMR
ncbi:MAG: Spy/CpxP family protein refolding chaperone, partial [Gammaproteobacteria bacterium]